MQSDATTYDAFAEQPEYIAANRAFVDALPLDGVRRVLDLACGTCLMTRLLLERLPAACVTGVDLSAADLDLARTEFREPGLYAESPDALEQAMRAGRGGVHLREGSADDLSAFRDGVFDCVMIGNAIHMLPDADRLLAEARRVLKTGGVFAFNTTFFAGTYPEGTEGRYGDWMRAAFAILREKDAALKAAGGAGIPRRRRKRGARRAMDNPWKSEAEWIAALERNGLNPGTVNRRVVTITREGLAAIGAYAGFAEVYLGAYPVDVAAACLREAAYRAFPEDFEGIPRYWLEITAIAVDTPAAVC
jgi:ubiquinone/menaquinone biosynthesis C-methylase UbiE